MIRIARRVSIALACALALTWAAAPWDGPAGRRLAGAEMWTTGQTMYVSDPCGFTVTYSNAWTVAGIGRDGTPDYVHLTNGISAVYLGAGAWSPQPVDAGDRVMQTLRRGGFPDPEHVGDLVYSETEYVVPGSESRGQAGLVQELWAGVTL